jgi:hypothetical protein
MTAQAYNVNDPVYGSTSVGAYQVTIAYVDGDSGRPVDTTLNGGTPSTWAPAISTITV